MAHRIERLNKLFRREISNLLQRQVKDPRLGAFIIVTSVDTSADLRHAKVFVSCMGSEEEKQKILKVLISASGFFRKELGTRLKLRHIPELRFQHDDSMSRGAEVLQLIRQVTASEARE